MSRERFDKLWSELNAEIEVQRHKAVIRTKKSTTNPFKAMRIPLPKKSSGNARQNLIIGRFPTSKAYSGILESCIRRVVLNKERGSTLGMSITVGLPCYHTCINFVITEVKYTVIVKKINM